ncbi:MAG: MEDS domain-containing protein [Pseudonocardiales bacterium]
MPVSGVTEAARSFNHHDHLCWAFDEFDEFHSRAVEFLADGLARGQRVWYVADGDPSTLWDGLRNLDETNQACGPGAVQVQSLGDRYPTGAVVVPATQVQAYAAATEDALAAGFTGLRVAAEATPLVRTPEQLDAFARYEHLVDRYMTSQPFSALCAYNRAELGEETIAQLASLHPAGSAPPFRLHACAHAAAALSGALDLTSHALLALALRRADLRPTGGELVLDATELDFIDHQSLLALAEYGRRRNAKVVLQTGLTGAARLCELLELKDLRVVEVPT